MKKQDSMSFRMMWLQKQLFYLCICICILQVRFVQAQSPYSLSTGIELPVLGGGLTLFGIDIALKKNFPSVVPDDTLGLDLQSIPSIDRHVVNNWSLRAHQTSDDFLRTSPVVPFALPLLAGSSSRHKMSTSYLIVVEGLLTTYTITELTKLLAKRKRPYVYGRSAFEGNRFTREAQKSFFSGHTSMTAVSYFLGAKMFNDFYPDSNWKPVVWTTAAIIPAITGWKRVQAGKHFVTDVLIGYAVGAAVGILIPAIHR